MHDATLDYYGRRLATCSSDHTIKIFEIAPSSPSAAPIVIPSSTLTATHAAPATRESSTQPQPFRLLANLTGHTSAVWCTSWAHPSHGTILASSSYTGHVFIWRESPPGTWTRVVDFALHSASVNSVAWAPFEAGCVLACASSDGAVSVIDFRDAAPAPAPGTAQQQQQQLQQGGAQGNGNFDHTIFHAHNMGVNAVSWAPALLPGTLTSAHPPNTAPPPPVRRFATGGSDCTVKIWEAVSPSSTPVPGTPANGYTCAVTLPGHGDWVRDVAWSPSALGKTYVASASQDKSVRVWTLPVGAAVGDEAAWKCKVLSFDVVVWRVSWSLSGNVLAVSGGDNKVTLWRERTKDGEWVLVKTVDE
ncbi:hypothetical protein MRB53_038765 [Persea americana]|nr:hypothetical protein MRB53_038765 [Persea americana]